MSARCIDDIAAWPESLLQDLALILIRPATSPLRTCQEGDLAHPLSRLLL